MSEKRNDSMQNDAQELYDLGIHYINNGDEKKGMRYLHEAARNGYAHAYYAMSTHLTEIANGNAQLETQARQYMELAIRAGDPDALFVRGVRLCDEEKYKEAAALFRQAIKSDHPGSLRALAELLATGKEKRQENDDYPYRYLQRAAELGDDRALFTLARGYNDDGWGANYKSPIKARELYIRAAHQGSVGAIGKLALDYTQKLPVRDFQESEMWLNILASLAEEDNLIQDFYNVVKKGIERIYRALRESCLFPLNDDSNELLSHMRQLYFAADNIRSIDMWKNRLKKTYDNRVAGSKRDSNERFRSRFVGLGNNIGHALWCLINLRVSISSIHSIISNGFGFINILFLGLCIISWILYSLSMNGKNLISPFIGILHYKTLKQNWIRHMKENAEEKRREAEDIKNQLSHIDSMEQEAIEALQSALSDFESTFGFKFPSKYCTSDALRFICEALTNLWTDKLTGADGAFQLYENELKNRQIVENTNTARAAAESAYAEAQAARAQAQANAQAAAEMSAQVSAARKDAEQAREDARRAQEDAEDAKWNQIFFNGT